MYAGQKFMDFKNAFSVLHKIVYPGGLKTTTGSYAYVRLDATKSESETNQQRVEVSGSPLQRKLSRDSNTKWSFEPHKLDEIKKEPRRTQRPKIHKSFVDKSGVLNIVLDESKPKKSSS